MPSLRSLGVAARRRGDHATALQHFREAAARRPDDPLLHSDIGAAALAVGQVQEAEEAYRLALRARPDLVDALRGLGHCARRRGDRREALSHFEAAVAGSDDARPRFEVAAERIALGDADEVAYHDLLADPATRSRACLEVARGLDRKGELSRARAWLEQAVMAEPSDRSAKLELAALQVRCWRLDSAAVLYDQLLAAAPGDVDALLGRGALARRRGDRAKSRECFGAAWRLDPRRGAVEWAREERDAGALDRAREVLGQLLRQQPSDASLMVQLGLTERADGATEQAITYFADALLADPGHLSAQVEMAADLHRVGRTQEARRLLDDARAARPDHPRILEALGDLAVAREDVAEAVDLFRRAAAGAPGQVAPLCKLARGLAALGLPDDALTAFAEATTATGPSPDLFIGQAQILKETGRLDEAAATFRNGIVAFPSNFALWLQASLFRIDWDRGTDLEGLPLRGPAATPAEALKTHLVAGAAAAARWNFDEALDAFRHALDPQSRDGATHARIAQAALCALDLATADRHLLRLSQLEAPTKRLRGQRVGLFHSLLGQILEEARLDIEALSHLLVAASGPDDARLPELFATVRAFPETTLAAMQTAIEGRRCGLFDEASSPSADDRPAIPRSIVQFWHDEALPSDVEVYCRSWQERNPDCIYRRYSDREALIFIKAECGDQVVTAFQRARDPAARADLFRLAYLSRRGGIYADIDDRCLASLTDLRARGGLVLTQEDIGSLGNDLMMAAPHHPLIDRALDLASQAIIRGDSDILWLSTGPGLLTRVVMQAAAAGGSESFRDLGVTVIERRRLLHVAATGCTAAYKSTRRHWSRAAFTKNAPRSDGSPPRSVAAAMGNLPDERRSSR